MSDQPFSPIQKIIVAVQSPAWCSSIRQHFPPAQLSWVLGVESIEKTAIEIQAVVAIVELRSRNAAKICEKISSLANNSQNVCLIAVGDEKLGKIKPLLHASGFHASYWSLLQTPGIVQAVTRHIESLPTRDHSVEQIVESTLPWPAAKIDRQA